MLISKSNLKALNKFVAGDILKLTVIFSGRQTIHMKQQALQSNALSKHPRDNPDVVAKDRCLLNTGEIYQICLFGELMSCLLNTGCLLNSGGHYDRFYCIFF